MCEYYRNPGTDYQLFSGEEFLLAGGIGFEFSAAVLAYAGAASYAFDAILVGMEDRHAVVAPLGDVVWLSCEHGARHAAYTLILV